MTTPQNPGHEDDGNTPQDPTDPTNPYGSPTPPPPPPPPNDPTIDTPPPSTPPPYSPPPSTPPPASPPPPPPVTGIPPAPSPYGTTPPAGPTPAVPPPYGDPAAPAAPPPPPAAPPAYGQPNYGQPDYGQAPPMNPMPAQPYVPGAPGAPGADQPGRGMAIASLILAFLGCLCITLLVAVPLAIVVLIRGRDGRNHGKGLAIAALVVSALYLVGWVVGGGAIYNYAKDFKDVNQLKAGDCITADGLSDAKAKSISNIKTISCSSKHDGEVLATVKLTADQAKNYSTTPFATICDPAIASAGKTGVLSDKVIYTAIANSDPKSGDHAACVAYNADGSKLTSKLSG